MIIFRCILPVTKAEVILDFVQQKSKYIESSAHAVGGDPIVRFRTLMPPPPRLMRPEVASHTRFFSFSTAKQFSLT